MQLRQAWERPTRPRPIVVIGAGAIVRTSHLPAYRRLGLPVAGLFDVRLDAARDTASTFGVPVVHESLREAVATADAVFDVAVPGDQVPGVLSALPAGSLVLIQKPMGENLASARRILAMCQERRLVAAINFQLRFSPRWGTRSCRTFATREAPSSSTMATGSGARWRSITRTRTAGNIGRRS